ncbi:hypothetical protein ABDD95_08260 [Mucilaginibacter sp. PAMB04274]|uniref:hypothetical protein n=1 Tax=Mucilaginibacter sp. PAMB04274 TaxID=3138568 RepID=UPI0031F6191C
MPIPAKLLTRKDEITKDFLQLFEEHISALMSGQVQERYSASQFASLLFIAPGHLTNTIKLTTGKSPCDFMEERLLLEAQKMLQETNFICCRDRL